MVAAVPRKIKKLTREKIAAEFSDPAQCKGRFDLTDRGIESIVSLDGLETATKLDLSRNKLTKLTQLKTIPNVTMLKLTGNRLNGEGLAELRRLQNLIVLNAAENQITHIAIDTLRHLKHLKALVLNNNSITTLEWMPRLPELNSLIVSHNRIPRLLPVTIKRLTGLAKISMTHNLLEASARRTIDFIVDVRCSEVPNVLLSFAFVFPQEIPDLSSCTELIELRLSHNRIKAVPASLAKLDKLKVLELGHNLIEEWEGIEALAQLANLKQLSLTGNPLYGAPLDASRDKAADSAAEEDEDDEAKAKAARKQAKRLEATHKQYNFKMKRLFPNLVIRDGHRMMSKKVHGFVPPPEEEKKPKQVKPQKKQKKEKPTNEAGGKSADRVKRQRSIDDSNQKQSQVEEPLNEKKKRRKTSITPSTEPTFASESNEEKPKAKHQKKHPEKHAPDTAEKQGKSSKHAASKPSSEPSPAKPTTKSATKTKASQAEIVAASTLSSHPKKDSDKQSHSKNKDKSKDKGKDKNKRKQEPKDKASGVLAVKKFKKTAKQAVDPSTVALAATTDAAHDVGLGGASAWD